MNSPYGGKLINKRTNEFPSHDFVLEVDIETAKDAINIATGLYSPLEGFMNKDDYDSVIANSKLSNGQIWTIPIQIFVPSEIADKAKLGTKVKLVNKDLEFEAILIVEDKYEINTEKYNISIFGTNDSRHPGCARMESNLGKKCLGGEVYLINYSYNKISNRIFTPEEIRQIFKKNKWNTVVAFQTRNPPHISHEYIQKVALEFVDGLFVNPIFGQKKKGDFKDQLIINTYSALFENYYPQNSTFLAAFPSKMYYAGPKEAVFHAIVRKNYGCTHFIVGRDHAGVGSYYDKMAAHKIFDTIGDIGINIIKFSNAFYSPHQKMFVTEKVATSKDIQERIDPSGTKVREFVSKKNIAELNKIMRPEVIKIILEEKEPFV